MATNLNILNSAASQGGTYQQYLQRLAGGSGLEAREAQALLSGGMGSSGGVAKNALVNVGGGLTGNYGLAQGLGYDQYGQVKGGYGPQGLSDLNNIYAKSYASANQGNTSDSYGGSGGGNYASAAQLAEYDQGIGQLEHGIGRLDNQLGIALGNIGTTYGQRNNELQGTFDRAKNQYGTRTPSISSSKGSISEPLKKYRTKIEHQTIIDPRRYGAHSPQAA